MSLLNLLNHGSNSQNIGKNEPFFFVLIIVRIN